MKDYEVTVFGYGKKYTDTIKADSIETIEWLIKTTNIFEVQNPTGLIIKEK